MYVRYVLLCLAAIVSSTASGQTIVSGIVVDSTTLAALPSVNVQIKGGSTGTRTDINGRFKLEASPADTLIFSLVSYQSLELPLQYYEEGVIRLSEKYTLLEAVTIDEYRAENLYQGMFDERNARLRRKIPFYFSKAKKEKIKLEGLRQENLRVQTYVEVVVQNDDLKRSLMEKNSLTEDEYYNTLTAFNERHHEIMYYLTRSELISLINTFFEAHSSTR